MEKKFYTSSGILTKPYYTPDDIKGIDHSDELNDPGHFPFTSGIHSNMYRGRLWTVRQVAGYGNPEESNKRLKYLLSQGETGINVVFDWPTHMGYDSDHPLAEDEVGMTGVPIDTLDDMFVLFEDIPIDKISVSLIESVAATPIIMAMYIALAQERGIPLDRLAGSIQNDVLVCFIACGKFCEYPPRPALRIVTDIFAYCSQHMPKWNVVTVAGYQAREAGASAIQELAFCLANGTAYVEAAIRASIDVDAFSPRLAFYLSSNNDFFEEIAKMRAARRMWARIMRERFHAKNPRSWLFRFHTQTSANTLTAQQPLNNLIRCTIQALAAVLGGTQSLHVNSWDEALGLPSEGSATLSLRTHQIIAHENNVAHTVDPLAGSYFIEYLTGQIENEANKYLKRIESMGNGSFLDGVIEGIEKGFFEREILETDWRHQKAFEDREKIVVGVNAFTQDERPAEIFKVDPSLGGYQVSRLRKVKEERDSERVQKALEGLKRVAEGKENLIPIMIEAVKARATLGEVSEILRTVFGRYSPVKVI